MPLRKKRGFRRKCVCSLCKQSRWVKTVMTNGSHQQKNRLITELMGELCSQGEDLNYHQAILDGSWPTAVEQLEVALAKAKAIAMERAEAQYS